jgi:hypothetical protein
MSVYAGIKRDGGRCTAPALPGEGYCYGHHPDFAEKRRRNAAKSHKARSASPEIAAIKNASLPWRTTYSRGASIGTTGPLSPRSSTSTSELRAWN